MVTHSLGGLAVFEELGRGAAFGRVRVDGVAGVGPFHGRGRGGIRGAEARDRGRIPVVRMGVVKRRWVAEERLLNRPEGHGTSKRVVLDVLHPFMLRVVVMVVIIVIDSAPLHREAVGAIGGTQRRVLVAACNRQRHRTYSERRSGKGSCVTREDLFRVRESDKKIENPSRQCGKGGKAKNKKSSTWRRTETGEWWVNATPQCRNPSNVAPGFKCQIQFSHSENPTRI